MARSERLEDAMPRENEVKYILDDARGDLEGHLAASPDWVAYDVLQAYLGKGTRIRRFTPLAGGAVEYVFSFKRRVDGEAVEIETPMAERDFLQLLPTAETVLSKRRYKLQDRDVAWDVDFLKAAGGDTYCALAEAEMPEGMDQPARVPACVAEHVLHYAGRAGGYSSRKLSDPAYVAKVMSALRADARSRRCEPRCDPGAYSPSAVLAA